MRRYLFVLVAALALLGSACGLYFDDSKGESRGGPGRPDAPQHPDANTDGGEVPYDGGVLPDGCGEDAPGDAGEPYPDAGDPWPIDAPHWEPDGAIDAR